MLHGGDGIRPVIVLPYSHAAEQALAQGRQFQPPHAVRRPPLGQLADGHTVRGGVRGDRDGNRLAIAAHQVQHHIAACGYLHLTVQRKRPGQAVDRQDASAHGHAGIITVADLDDIAGYMSQPLSPYGKIHRLRFQQFGGDSPQSGAVPLSGSV